MRRRPAASSASTSRPSSSFSAIAVQRRPAAATGVAGIRVAAAKRFAQDSRRGKGTLLARPSPISCRRRPASLVRRPSGGDAAIAFCFDPGCDGDKAKTAATEESDEREDPDAAFACALKHTSLTRAEYYDLSARISQQRWAHEWILPRPASLRNCCLIPTIGGVGLIGARLAELSADVVVSLGSGAGLVEWLLAGRFHVVGVDTFYAPRDKPQQDGHIDAALLAPASASAVRVHAGAEAHRSGDVHIVTEPPDDDGRLCFVRHDDPTGLREEVGECSVALLLCWPQLTASLIENYVAALGPQRQVLGMVFVAGENCWPRDPCDAAEASGCMRSPIHEGENVKCLSESCLAWTFAAKQ